ncbi:MAG: hypothetical protein ACTSRJ_07195, partial [Candidatus Hodarchaeales archaeon]
LLIQFSLFLLFISIIFFFFFSWHRIYYFFPKLETLKSYYKTKSDIEIKKQLVSNINDNWKKNNARLEKVATYVKIGLITQITAFIFLGLSLLFSII